MKKKEPPYLKKGTEIRLFTDKENHDLINGIFAGAVTIEKLPRNFYEKIAGKLMEGVTEGYGKSFHSELATAQDIDFLNYLQENTFVFSGAKTYQEVRELSNALTSDGERRTWEEFHTAAQSILDDYNEAYLRTEYNFAIGKSRAASDLMDAYENKDILPNFLYQTVNDDRVRPEHEELDGICLPVDNEFWDSYYPPWEWNCRCIAEQTDDDETPQKTIDNLDLPETDPVTSFNPVKEKVIFSPEHPYFDVAERDRELASNNFNLPLPNDFGEPVSRRNG